MELYRDTRDSIVRGSDPEVWEAMPEASRDRALLAELKAERNLHPALYPADPNMGLGHYKVMPATVAYCRSHLLEKDVAVALHATPISRALQIDLNIPVSAPLCNKGRLLWC